MFVGPIVWEWPSVVASRTACLCEVPQEEVDEAREVLVGMEEKKKVLDEV